GSRADRVAQGPDSRNLDLDNVARPEIELVRRDQAGTRQQHAARRGGVLATEPVDEVFKRALHLRRRGLARKELTPILLDAQANLERTLPLRQDRGAERARARKDLRLGQVERVRALDVARGYVVADRDAVDPTAL